MTLASKLSRARNRERDPVKYFLRIRTLKSAIYETRTTKSHLANNKSAVGKGANSTAQS